MPDVKLILHENMLYVEPWLSAFDTVCTFTHRKALYGEERFLKKKEYEYRKVPMFVTFDNGNGQTFAGLLTRLVNFCNHGKITFLLEDRNPPLPVLSSDVEGFEYRTGQRPAVQAILQWPRGVIKAPPAYGKTEVIAALCKIFGDRRIIVTTRRKDVLEELVRRFGTVEGKITLCNATHPFKDDSRIVVCSDMSLHHVPDEWPEVLFFDEIHNAGADVPSRQLPRFQKARMYGFSATPKGRSDGTNLITEAFFGPIIYEMSYQEAVDVGNVVPVEVRRVPVGGDDFDHFYDRSNPWATKISLERHGIWRNEIRNRKIQQCVVKLLSENLNKILILVSTAEHCYYLRELLPDFAVVHAPMDADRAEKLIKQGVFTESDTLAPDVEDIRQRFRNGNLTGVISTKKWQDGVDIPVLQAVIRADGQSGEIPVVQGGGRIMRLFEGKTKGIVVDFTDRFGEILSRRSDARVRQYQKTGWQVIDWPV